ncbi:MAG: aspartate aminotransferase family protein [Alphaproteobacteria bacterium]|nr:aspartate aminotransferase family protein [Alphaproteobacteria bacterium]
MITATMPTYARIDLAFAKGESVYLFTADGRRYLDFGCGIAVTGLGHCHPHLVHALQEQAGRLWHVSNLYRIPEQERLAERLVAASFADTVFFANSGAEAVECGLKMVRKYHDDTGHPERYRVITFASAFHGRTLATISAGRQPKHIAGFAPLVEGFDQVPFGDLDAVRAAIGRETAAILVEPIIGESGVRPAPAGFLRGLRELADQNGLLLFFDEVQTGFGRTGTLFAYEGEGAAPDVMATAKQIAGGFPMGACLATEKAAVGMVAGAHGSTFGGNPLACAVANAALDVVLEPGFLPHVRAMGAYLRERLEALSRSNSRVIEEVRGRGLMMGVKTRCPNAEMIDALRAHGLITVSAGDNVVRVYPPLIVERPHIDEAMEIFMKACAELGARAG